MLLVQCRDRVRVRPEVLLTLIYALFFVSGLAQAAIVPLLPRLADRYGLSASETALLLALPGLAMLAVSVPAGVAADRFGARRVTLGAGALLCIGCLAQSTPSLLLLLAGRIAFGVGFGVVWTTGVAWLAEMDTTGTAARTGPSVTCSSVGMMVGPAVGGGLAEHTAVGVPFLLIAVATALVVAPLALGSPDGGGVQWRERADGGRCAADAGRCAADAGRCAAGGGPRAAAGADAVTLRSLAALVRRPGVAAAAGALMVSGAVSGASQLLISSGLHHDGVSMGLIGLAFSASSVCYVVVSIAVMRLGDRARTLRFNAVATLLAALALAPAVLSGGVSVLVFALLLAGMSRAAISTIAYALASRPEYGAGSGDDGSVFGMVNGAWAAAMVLMPLLAGAMEQHGGASAGYLVVIVPTVAIAVALIARARAGVGARAGAGVGARAEAGASAVEVGAEVEAA